MAELRRRFPGDRAIVDAEGQFAKEAIRLSRGEGVHVVYDGSGPEILQASLASLRRCGTFCWYGPVLGRSTSRACRTASRSAALASRSTADAFVAYEMRLGNFGGEHPQFGHAEVLRLVDDRIGDSLIWHSG